MKEMLIEKLDAVPEAVKDTMLQNFQIDGVVPITHAQVESMMAGMKEVVLSAIRAQSDTLMAALQRVANVSADTAMSGALTQGVRSWTWGGRIHPVPETFHFPK